jgi:NADH-quinone oxidoreductase subunit G
MSAEMERPVEMVNIEVDGKAMQAPKGSMIIEATDRAGIEIPRFCYHPKLTIAANCRMCLVDVEKMPKPVPACATPVMDGMKIYTGSRRAIDAQHGVMEFLLINHPLDCPICDQGGECELQDLAMGYGRSVSRFTERKRVVKDKNVGPLVQTEMTRCIHCTRCVRFLEEIAGTSEMGGAGRGDRLEIGTCVENSISSELSGNIIDLCPVGALTNKPYRFSARAWELVARPAVAAHDGVGSNLHYHVRNGRVLRCVPRENEQINESWLADRDRYSHFGLYADDRVLHPEVKENGAWKKVSWDEAIVAAAAALRGATDRHGAGALAALMSPSAATEEYFLAQALVRQLGSNNIDHRLRESDFSDDPARPLSPAFALPLAEFEGRDAILLIGCNPRQEAPMVGHRVRQAWRKGALVSAINPLDWPFTFDTGPDAIVAPQQMVGELAALAAAVEHVSGKRAPGNLRAALDSAAAGERQQQLAERLNGSARGSHDGGSHAGRMLETAQRAYLLWGIEPDYDCDNPARAMQALAGADSVVAVVSFATDSLRQVADVILPLAPHAEAEGSFISLDGTTQQFAAAGKAQGEARPGWKILRKLGSELDLEGFEQISLAEVQDDLQRALQHGSVTPIATELTEPERHDGLGRIGEVAMYSVDALCRRSRPLQETEQAQSGFVGLNPVDAERLGLTGGTAVRIGQGEQRAQLAVVVSDRVPVGGAWLRSATCATRSLGQAVAPLTIEPAAAEVA